MNSQIRARTISIHRALLVKTNGDPSRFPTSGLIWNWCIGSILTLAGTLSLSPLGPVPARLLRHLPNFPRGGAEPEEQHHQHHPAGPDPAIDHPADQRAPERVADQDREDAHPRILPPLPGAYRPAGPRRLIRLRSGEPLVERGQPRILGR